MLSSLPHVVRPSIADALSTGPDFASFVRGEGREAAVSKHKHDVPSLMNLPTAVDSVDDEGEGVGEVSSSSSIMQ